MFRRSSDYNVVGGSGGRVHPVHWLPFILSILSFLGVCYLLISGGGPAGIDGISGVNGINGTDGERGDDGVSGVDGADGVNGTTELGGPIVSFGSNSTIYNRTLAIIKDDINSDFITINDGRGTSLASWGVQGAHNSIWFGSKHGANLRFGTNNMERTRISESGHMCVGNTQCPARFSVTHASTDSSIHGNEFGGDNNNGQFFITPQDETYRLALGYDSDRDSSILQSWRALSGAKNLALNPSGGVVSVGATSGIVGHDARLHVNGSVSARGGIVLFEEGSGSTAGWCVRQDSFSNSLKIGRGATTSDPSIAIDSSTGAVDMPHSFYSSGSFAQLRFDVGDTLPVDPATYYELGNLSSARALRIHGFIGGSSYSEVAVDIVFHIAAQGYTVVDGTMRGHVLPPAAGTGGGYIQVWDNGLGVTKVVLKLLTYSTVSLTVEGSPGTVTYTPGSQPVSAVASGFTHIGTVGTLGLTLDDQDETRLVDHTDAHTSQNFKLYTWGSLGGINRYFLGAIGSETSYMSLKGTVHTAEGLGQAVDLHFVVAADESIAVMGTVSGSPVAGSTGTPLSSYFVLFDVWSVGTSVGLYLVSGDYVQWDIRVKTGASQHTAGGEQSPFVLLDTGTATGFLSSAPSPYTTFRARLFSPSTYVNVHDAMMTMSKTHTNINTKLAVGTTASPASTAHVYESTAAVDGTNGMTIEQAGAGAASIHLKNGASTWSVGMDSTDALKVSTSADLSSPAMSINHDTKVTTLAGVNATSLAVSGSSTLADVAATGVHFPFPGHGLSIVLSGAHPLYKGSYHGFANSAGATKFQFDCTAPAFRAFGIIDAQSGLQVTGGTTTVETLTATQTSTLAGVTATSLGVSGTSTLAGVTATSIDVSGTSNLAHVQASSLSVTGTSHLGDVTADSLNVTTLTTEVSGTLNVTGEFDVDSLVAAFINGTGVCALRYANVDVLAVSGAATFDGTMTANHGLHIPHGDSDGLYDEGPMLSLELGSHGTASGSIGFNMGSGLSQRAIIQGTADGNLHMDAGPGSGTSGTLVFNQFSNVYPGGANMHIYGHVQKRGETGTQIGTLGGMGDVAVTDFYKKLSTDETSWETYLIGTFAGSTSRLAVRGTFETSHSHYQHFDLVFSGHTNTNNDGDYPIDIHGTVDGSTMLDSSGSPFVFDSYAVYFHMFHSVISPDSYDAGTAIYMTAVGPGVRVAMQITSFAGTVHYQPGDAAVSTSSSFAGVHPYTTDLGKLLVPSTYHSSVRDMTTTTLNHHPFPGTIDTHTRTVNAPLTTLHDVEVDNIKVAANTTLSGHVTMDATLKIRAGRYAEFTSPPNPPSLELGEKGVHGASIVFQAGATPRDFPGFISTTALPTMEINAPCDHIGDAHRLRFNFFTNGASADGAFTDVHGSLIIKEHRHPTAPAFDATTGPSVFAGVTAVSLDVTGASGLASVTAASLDVTGETWLASVTTTYLNASGGQSLFSDITATGIHFPYPGHGLSIVLSGAFPMYKASYHIFANPSGTEFFQFDCATPAFRALGIIDAQSGLQVTGGATTVEALTATQTSTLAGATATSLGVSGTSTLAGVTATSLGVSGTSTLAGVTATSLGVTGTTVFNSPFMQSFAGGGIRRQRMMYTGLSPGSSVSVLFLGGIGGSYNGLSVSGYVNSLHSHYEVFDLFFAGYAHEHEPGYAVDVHGTARGIRNVDSSGTCLEPGYCVSIEIWGNANDVESNPRKSKAYLLVKGWTFNIDLDIGVSGVDNEIHTPGDPAVYTGADTWTGPGSNFTRIGRLFAPDTYSGRMNDRVATTFGSPGNPADWDALAPVYSHTIKADTVVDGSLSATNMTTVALDVTGSSNLSSVTVAALDVTGASNFSSVETAGLKVSGASTLADVAATGVHFPFPGHGLSISLAGAHPLYKGSYHLFANPAGTELFKFDCTTPQFIAEGVIKANAGIEVSGGIDVSGGAVTVESLAVAQSTATDAIIGLTRGLAEWSVAVDASDEDSLKIGRGAAPSDPSIRVDKTTGAVEFPHQIYRGGTYSMFQHTVGASTITSPAYYIVGNLTSNTTLRIHGVISGQASSQKNVDIMFRMMGAVTVVSGTIHGSHYATNGGINGGHIRVWSTKTGTAQVVVQALPYSDYSLTFEGSSGSVLYKPGDFPTPTVTHNFTHIGTIGSAGLVDDDQDERYMSDVTTGQHEVSLHHTNWVGSWKRFYLGEVHEVKGSVSIDGTIDSAAGITQRFALTASVNDAGGIDRLYISGTIHGNVMATTAGVCSVAGSYCAYIDAWSSGLSTRFYMTTGGYMSWTAKIRMGTDVTGIVGRDIPHVVVDESITDVFTTTAPTGVHSSYTTFRGRILSPETYFDVVDSVILSTDTYAAMPTKLMMGSRSTPSTTAHVYDSTYLTGADVGLTVEQASNGDAAITLKKSGNPALPGFGTVTLGHDNSGAFYIANGAERQMTIDYSQQDIRFFNPIQIYSRAGICNQSPADLNFCAAANPETWGRMAWVKVSGSNTHVICMCTSDGVVHFSQDGYGTP